MKHALKLSILLILLFNNPTLASTSNAASGVGTLSCGKWLEYSEKESKELKWLQLSWLQGFLSGINIMRTIQGAEKIPLIPDNPTILAYIDKECRDHPLEYPYVIAVKLYKEMSK